uniref:thiol oxidase n=1 Tax=viral metagenome TaxID=1070528 RepID=A0A6C0CZD7_9ZZZZ
MFPLKNNYKLISELYNISEPDVITNTSIDRSIDSLSIWGPKFWYSLHNGAAKFPLIASNLYINKIKGFIIGLPYILPCEKCTKHAIMFIKKHYDRLDDICSGRIKLFNFFVDFHNEINVINGKHIMSYENAYKLYMLYSPPDVWGPKFWYSLHNGAAKYPIKASIVYINKMKEFILGIPYILSCEKCLNHANLFIEKHYDRLEDICSERIKLFDFFVDFHNEVNRINRKPSMSYEEAYKLYHM